MNVQDPTLYVFDRHDQAEEAIRALGKAGFDMTELSLIGKGYHSEEHPVGFYTVGDRMKSWGGTGAFWGAIWGLLLAPAVFFLPGLGVVALAGPIATLLAGAAEGAVVVGGVSVLGAALSRIGVKDDQIIRYEADLKADKYVLMVHGSTQAQEKAQAVLAKLRQAEIA